MTALQPLMTPSILSPATHADYPQRHLLTLYANETETGSNEKRVTDKKKKKEGENRNKKKDIGNREMKQIVRMCVAESRIKKNLKKTKVSSVNIHSMREIKTNRVGRVRKRKKGGTNEGHQQPYWRSLG